MILKKIEVLSAAKISAAMGVVGGLLAAILFAIPSLIFGSLMDAGGFGVGMGVGAIIFLPIMYGIAGFIGGAIYAFVYNIVSKWVGGIEIELVNVQAQPQTTVQPQPPVQQQ